VRSSAHPTNATASVSRKPQQVTLTGHVTSPFGTVNGGTLTFTVHVGKRDIVVTSGLVVNGTATASFTLPGGTKPGSYTIETAYSGFSGSGIPFAPSTNSEGKLIVGQGNPPIPHLQNIRDLQDVWWAMEDKVLAPASMTEFAEHRQPGGG
jgi:hypothetical protein